MLLRLHPNGWKATPNGNCARGHRGLFTSTPDRTKTEPRRPNSGIGVEARTTWNSSINGRRSPATSKKTLKRRIPELSGSGQTPGNWASFGAGQIGRRTRRHWRRGRADAAHQPALGSWHRIHRIPGTISKSQLDSRYGSFCFARTSSASTNSIYDDFYLVYTILDYDFGLSARGGRFSQTVGGSVNADSQDAGKVLPFGLRDFGRQDHRSEIYDKYWRQRRLLFGTTTARTKENSRNAIRNLEERRSSKDARGYLGSQDRGYVLWFHSLTLYFLKKLFISADLVLFVECGDKCVSQLPHKGKHGEWQTPI